VIEWRALEVLMGKQGVRTPKPIRRFIIEIDRNAPGLTNQQIADRVAASFGPASKLDRGTVGRIRNKAGSAVRSSGKDYNSGQMIPEVWPQGFLSTNKECLRGEAAVRWVTHRPQQRGDGFWLELGEEILLKSLKFLQGRQHQWDHPKRWKLELWSPFEIVREEEGEGFIEVDFEEPLSVCNLGVTILEPRTSQDHPPSTCWAIDNIMRG
jgi:hypothetical protein